MLQKQAFLCRIAVLTLVVSLSACASAPESPPPTGPEAVDDPWESMNRQSFDNNYFFDRLLIRPLAELYRATIPPGIRDRIAGILRNMKEPVILANDLMQGDFDKAEVTFERFSINTTLGIGGMWDWAGKWGMYQQTGDFGQTLASWGVGEGPYLMLPVFGPSDLRDAVGRGVDIVISPWQYLTLLDSMTTFYRFEAVDFSADALVKREQNIETIDAIRLGSLDTYAQIRSAYLQHRRKQLGDPPPEDPPKFDEYK